MLLEKKKQEPNNEDEIILSDDDFEDEDENLEQRQEINNISSTSLNSFFIPVDDILGSESILILKSLFSGIKKIVQQFNSSTQLIEQLMNKQNERKFLNFNKNKKVLIIFIFINTNSIFFSIESRRLFSLFFQELFFCL